MKTPFQMWFARVTVVLCVVFLSSIFALGGTSGPYVITNDDYPFPSNGISFFTIGAGGVLTLQNHVQTGGAGIAGGYFGANRLAVLNTTNNTCAYASEAATGTIVGVAVDSQALGGSAVGSATDTGTSNGIGLAINSQYLYANFSDSSNIGTFSVQPGCGLTFLNDINTTGVEGGFVNAMAVHGSILIVTYTDGSIESFNISSGIPVSNGDKQRATGSRGGESYPNGIDITQDGHFAIFGDTSTSMMVEVSDISSGKLTPTLIYHFKGGINSSNIMLSPDETLLYVANTQSDSISALFFNSTTGVPSAGCTSGKLKGYVSSFSYLSGLALQQATGNGGGVYAAEFGSTTGIAEVSLTVNGSTCTLAEASGSPVTDTWSIGLLSIGAYPPRSF